MALPEKPLLSIIVPVYNSGDYVDSLFAQFEEQDMSETELVFIDDGSIDDSYEKLLKWQEKAAYTVSVHHQENQGVSAARNIGLKRAKGSYVVFFDADDAVSPDYIQMLKQYASHKTDVLVFSSKRVNESFSRVVDPEQSVSYLTGNQMLHKFWEDPTRLGVVNLLVKRSFVEDRGITSAVGYKYYEDYDLLLQLFAQTDNILYTDKVLYFYIMRQGSAMGCFNADRINCLKLMKSRGEWLRQTAPEFAPVFEKWGTSRLYWSVLWQAALALPSYGEFAQFARITHARSYLVKLKDYPDKLLHISTLVFLICRPAYYVAVRLVGRRKSKVLPVRLKDIQPKFLEDINFY